MLVIKRTDGESIVIDERVTIHIGRVQGRKVSVAIDAPRAVRVRRAELPASPAPPAAPPGPAGCVPAPAPSPAPEEAA